MTMALDRGLVATDAGRVAGGEPGRPDPEVPERARRRSFTARYKLEVLAAYDAAEPGEKGAILRREGLYSSHIVESRRARDAGALAGAVTAKRLPGFLGGRCACGRSRITPIARRATAGATYPLRVGSDRARCGRHFTGPVCAPHCAGH